MVGIYISYRRYIKNDQPDQPYLITKIDLKKKIIIKEYWIPVFHFIKHLYTHVIMMLNS